MGQVQCQGVNAARSVTRARQGRRSVFFQVVRGERSVIRSPQWGVEIVGRQILEREVLSGDFDSIRTYFHCSAIQACNARNSPACLSTRPRTGRDPG